jgi:very-short-patch-repair endonuclease
MPNVHQQRLVSMLEYLEHWDKLNRVPVFDVNAHQGLLLWQNDISDLPGISFNSADITGDVWMTLERLRPIKPPHPPLDILPWIVVSDDPRNEPHRRETLPHPSTPDEIENFDDDPTREEAFTAYLEGAWKKWSYSEIPRRTSITVYDKLFNLLQTIETAGAETPLEVVWGIGIALWKPAGHPQLRYPLISRLVEIDPVGSDMALRLRPRDVRPILETDAFAAMNNPGLIVFEKAAQVILDSPDIEVTPFDDASFEQILAGAAGTLDRQARYWPRDPSHQPGTLPPISEALTITDSWVVFARRKGTNFLIEDVRRLKVKVEEGDIPAGAPTVLVDTPEGEAPTRVRQSWRGLSSTGITAAWAPGSSTTTNPSPSRELYFPKPFNDEQVQIIDRLENSDGVVVQGPPGTGKTHTIANVICHYLAEGKRVLVTSKGESALQVLREKLPLPIQHLTVSLLTNEREGLKQLELGVTKITTEIATLDTDDVRRQITRVEARIGQLHQKLQEIDRQLISWAKKNIDEVPYSLGGLRPAQLASIVVEEAAVHEWFPDSLDSRSEHELTIDDADVDALHAARAKSAQNLIYLRTQLPVPDDLPSASTMAELHRMLLEYKQLSATLDDGAIERLKAPNREDLSKPECLNRVLDNAVRVAGLLREAAETRRQFSDSWIEWLRQGFEAKHAAHPAFLVSQQMTAEFKALVETRRQFIGVAITWQDDWDDDQELLAALNRSSQAKSAFGMFTLGQRTAKHRLEQIRINGQFPKTPQEWKKIESHVILRKQTRVAIASWNALANDCPSPTLPPSPNDALRAAEKIIEQASMAQRWALEIAPNLANDIEAVFADVRSDGVVDDPERMARLAVAIDLRVRRKRLESAGLRAAQLRKAFGTSSLPLFVDAQNFFDEYLGKTGVGGHTIESLWNSTLQGFTLLRDLQPAFETIHRVSLLLESNGAPLWAEQLRTQPVLDGGDSILRPHWRASWKWRRQNGHLLLIDGRQQMTEISRQRVVFQRDLGKSYADLVEQLTWLKLKETLDKDRGLMAALNQYIAAVRSIGKGTGVAAGRHRRNARIAMQRANKAVRCWIMPHWRISESIPPDMASFDLVVLDEASQSDMWALPAILRGKKLLVVGDDKQVSPSAVGVKNAHIQQLADRFLRDLPFGDMLTPDKSVYDLACVMFASDLLRLREHFRCVEPIIDFSNHLCYNGEIKYLRVPTAIERITPPLVDVFVKDGARDGRGKINKLEAQAIVNEIKFLAQHPQYADRTIGVVSLLGGEQAALIRDMLVTQIGEDAIIAHQIRCGDAMTFQGREADIILLSMVADANNVTALTATMYEQRFNVAVSRAKDRLYLFRSFKRDDLRSTDLRAKLLDHFASPLKRDIAKKGRDRCESDFERSVYDRLNLAGYRVLTQVPAGSYRIDLVVEGTAGRRLAVECDGDQYHGPDVWMEDVQRQRTLERAGWTFWRCWGSSWMRNPDQCFQDLLGVLKDHEIDPIGALDSDLSDVVEYREVFGIEPETFDDEVLDIEIESEDSKFATPVQDEDLATEAGTPDAPRAAPKKADDVSDSDIRTTIQYVLKACPNQTCTVDSLPARVLKAFGIRTRSGPRAEFEKRVQRCASKLVKSGVLERYSATNERYRLVMPDLI